MTVANQFLGFTQGDSFTFGITMEPDADGNVPNLSGATADWYLLEGDFAEAAVLVHKTFGTGVSITQIDSVWNIIVALASIDTAAIPPGLYYHKCLLTMSDGSVSHPETGPFQLSF